MDASPNHPDSRNKTSSKIKPIKCLKNSQYITKHKVYHPKNLKVLFAPISNYGNESKLPIKKSSKFLESQDIISDACYSLNDKTSFQNNYFSSRIRNLSPSLTSLQLEAWSQMDETRSKVIFRSLSSLKNLRNLDLMFFFCHFPVTDDLRSLFKRLLYFKNLDHFSFFTMRSSGFAHIHFKALCSALMRPSQLRSLKLAFDYHDQYTDVLIPALSKLTNLTKITLSLKGDHQIKAENIFKLFLTLGSIDTLKDIRLHFFCPITIENTNIEHWRGLEYLNASSIRKLRLDPEKDLTRKSLMQISQALEKFASLQIFYLTLPNSREITAENLSQLSTTIQKLTSLISLTLVLPSFTENFALAIRSLKNLVDLKLYFQNPNISPKQVELLASSLKTRKSSLKFLEISFPRQSPVSNSMMKNLAGAIQELTLLTHLSLSFIDDPEITSEGVEALSSAVQRLVNLSSLSLTFLSNQGIDERAVSYLSKILQSLPSLYSFGLNLTHCKKISSKENNLEGLFEVLCEMRNIQKINLSLPPCDDSSVGIIKLKQRLDLYVSKDSSSLSIINT